MALSGALLGSLIYSNCSQKGFSGSKLLDLSNAIGNGIINEILSSNSYMGTATGTAPGSGVGTGTVQGIVGASIASSIITFVGVRSIVGDKMPDLASAIGDAFATHIASGIIQSTSAPVAIGSGLGLILGITGPGVGSSIHQMMLSASIQGDKSGDLANGIGDAIASAFLSAKGITTITGAVGYPISVTTGLDQGRLF